MSININNLVTKPIDTVHTVHGNANIRNVLKKLINKKASTIIIVHEHDKLPGGFADHTKQKNYTTRKGDRKTKSFVRRRRAKLKTVL